ncbi:MAG: hypothetical protein IT559_04450 [Alphaproteobacteria bacterium]|nr:hypothetical protein [Alphaproteobacteria bacterium]
MQKTKPGTESGNVFVFILLGIVLFAALSFTVARGMRSGTTHAMTSQKAALAAADILDYAQRTERALDRLRRKGISENDISFEQTIDAGYDAHAQPDANKIFYLEGGGLVWKNPPSDANDGSAWLFTGRTCIADIGTGATGCDSDTTANEELLAVLPNIDPTVCAEIDQRLGISTIPADSGGGASGVKYIGVFADGTEIILPGGPFNAACFSRGGLYHFYSVLLAR